MDNPTENPKVIATPVDMRDPAFRLNPHPLQRALREQGRVSRDVVGVCCCATTRT